MALLASIRSAVTRALRVALPLGALALLSTIFLLSRSIDPDLAVQQSEIDIAELTREPRIGAARIAGVTREDTAMIIEAAAMRALSDLQERAPLELAIDAPRGALDFPSSRRVEFHAQEGHLDREANLLTMRGDVTLTTSDGYAATMRVLTSALNRTELRGTGGVTGHGPPGEIEANEVTLTPSPVNPDGYLLAFSGNVRLIYRPDHD